MRIQPGWAVLTVMAWLAGCGSSDPAPVTSIPPAAESAPAPVYAALGASDTVGVGLADRDLRLRDSWPQVFYNAALPQTATLYNLGVPGATVRDALSQQLPTALAVHPTIVTVWLNVDDLLAGVPAADYEIQLRNLVHQLRNAGSTVMVATTPVLDHLPAYLACLSNGRGGCRLGLGFAAPPPDAVRAAVDAYNAAIKRVTVTEGGVLVDLHDQGDVPTLHPEWVGPDGFHPSVLGQAAVARAFVDAYRTSLRR